MGYCSPASFELFARATNSLSKCRRYVAISIVAHGYEATNVAEWAMERALSMLETRTRGFALDTELLLRLYHLAGRWKEDAEIERNLIARARRIWYDAMYSCTAITSEDLSSGLVLRDCDGDPISLFHAALTIKNTKVEAHALFYILARGNRYIHRNQDRLTSDDRMRLLLGDRALSAARPFSEVQAHEYPEVLAVTGPSAARLPSSAVHVTASTSRGSQMAHKTAIRIGITSPELQAQIEKKWASSWRPRLHTRLSGANHVRNELWKSFNAEPWSLYSEND